MRRILVCVLFVALAARARAGDDEKPARAAYNEAVGALRDGDLDEAEKEFLDARGRAAADEELRYRAAFNLGMTYAARADKAEDAEDKAKALRQSAGWFRDAVRLVPKDDDARVNLEIILSRLRALADELNKGKNGLEARLDRLLEDERKLRDQVRALWSKVVAAGAASEPLSFKDDFRGQATRQRTLLADAGTIYDMAAAELDQLEAKKDDEQTPQDKARRFQLEGLHHYLEKARQAMAETRVALRDLSGERAHRRSVAAIHQLKRAREQLEGPVAILRHLLTDQAGVQVQTTALQAVQSGSVKLEGGETAKAPPWLDAASLATDQRSLRERLTELSGRLKAAAEHRDESGDDSNGIDVSGGDRDASVGAAAPTGKEAAQKRLIEAAARALPHLEQADGAMNEAAIALDGEELESAAAGQKRALEALARAAEEFSGVRELIEIAYADQKRAVDLLTPPSEDEETGEKDKAPPLSPEERATAVRDVARRNRERMSRLAGLLKEKADAITDDDPQADGKRELYRQAEQARASADEALARLEKLLAGRPQKEAAGAAREALDRISDLRRLFFSVVEHLKELLRKQGDTLDQTAAAQAEVKPEPRARALGPASQAQSEHATEADAIAQALEKQAEQAATKKSPQAAGGRDPSQALSEAAAEVNAAVPQMQRASSELSSALEVAKTQSYDLDPAMKAQKSALEHLENALRALQPPKQNKNQNQQQNKKQNQQKKGQQNKKQQDQKLSPQQARRRLQEIRDREAKRRRQRSRARTRKPEPVEKDW